MPVSHCAAFQIAVVLTAVFLASESDSFAQQWSQWRGEARDGVLEKAIEPGEAPTLNWTAEVGGGYSGPTLADGKVYLMDRVAEPKQIEQVHCFDLKTGESVWTHQYDAVYELSLIHI